jgi:Ca2+-transporting ATPase
VREGRRIYDNILKFIEYLMTTNSGELWLLLIGPLLGLPVALLPIHILWINLVTDGLPAISLSFEKAEKDIMNRPPRPPQENVFANGRGFRILYMGVLMAGIALSMQGWAIANGYHWQTIVFNVVCLSQMGNVLAIRSQQQSLFAIGVFSNKLMVWSVLVVFLLQLVITYIPFFEDIFHTEALTLKEFLLVIGGALLFFIAAEVQKVVTRLSFSKTKKVKLA